MVRLVRSVLLLLSLALLPACAASERATALSTPEAIPAPQLQAERPVATKVATTRTVTVRFDTNSADIRAAAVQIMYGAAVELRGAHVSAIRVTGYADAAGRRTYNQKLSQRRANAVADELRKLGVRAERIEVTGVGEVKGGPRHSPADRRVEITFEAEETVAALPQAQPNRIAAATAARHHPAAAMMASAALPAPLATTPTGEPAAAPLRDDAKPVIKLVPARDGTTWLPPPTSRGIGMGGRAV